MTREEVVRLAKESEAYRYTNRFAVNEPSFAFSIDKLERFAALIEQRAAQAEREACARVCEAEARQGYTAYEVTFAKQAAAAIRARKEEL